MSCIRLPLVFLAFSFVIITNFQVFAKEQENPQRPPNVILVYSDDQGAVDLGCYGTKDILTPNIDCLAAKGVRFTQMYAPAPVCSASRAGLMTGKIPFRAGVPGNVSSTRGDGGMPTEETTIAEVFKKGGYVTGHFGKWHLGYSPETMPLGQGFDESYGNMGGCIDNYSHYFYWAGPNRHDLWRNGREIFEAGKYYPERITDECVSFIERSAKNRREKPFFVYLAYNMPHYPLQPTMELLEKHRALQPVDVLFAGKRNPKELVDRDSDLAVRTLYAAFVSSMDEQIGRVVQALEKQGLTENTIVIFQADQGHSFEERSFFGGGWAGRFRGGKFSLFEGGIRVPSVVSWPGTLPENTVCTETVHANDWLPTLASFCGVSVPDDLDLDGKDIRRCIEKNAPSPHESLYWHFNKQWAVRKGDWKLYANAMDPSTNEPVDPKDAKFLLVDLEKDPSERTNLAEQNPEIVRELREIQKRYQERTYR